MPYSIFYSSLTGQPLENAVVVPDGSLWDRSEVEQILALNKPWKDAKGRIVEGPLTQTQDVYSLEDIKHSMYHVLFLDHQATIEINLQSYTLIAAAPITRGNDLAVKSELSRLILEALPKANFIQSTIDRAYNDWAWPKRSALRENAVLALNKASAPPADDTAAREIYKQAVGKVFAGVQFTQDASSLNFLVIDNPNNLAQAKILKEFGIISNHVQRPIGGSSALEITKFDPKKLIEQAEAARKMMLDMRRILMNKPVGLMSKPLMGKPEHLTDEVEAQKKLIFSLDSLDKPLLNKNGDELSQTASVQDALAILQLFSNVQVYSTAHLNASDDAYAAWHKHIGKNRNRPAILDYHLSLLTVHQVIIIDYTSQYSNAATLIQEGEIARLLLEQIKPLSRTQENIGSSWPLGIKDQRSWVDSNGLGVLSQGLSQSLLNDHLSEAYKVERAKLYIDTAKAIFAISQRELARSGAIDPLYKGERAWHETIAVSTTQAYDTTKLYQRVMAKKEKKNDPTLIPLPKTAQEIHIDSPFEKISKNDVDYITRCHLSGVATQNPVIFVDGYTYDGPTLFAYLQSGRGVDAQNVWISPAVESLGDVYPPINKYFVVNPAWYDNADSFQQRFPVANCIANNLNIGYLNKASSSSSSVSSFEIPPYVPPQAFNPDILNEMTQTIAKPSASSSSTAVAPPALPYHVAQPQTFDALRSFVPVVAEFKHQNHIVVIALQPVSADKYKYGKKILSLKAVQDKITLDLEYLKNLQIISQYSFNQNGQVYIYGFSQDKLLLQANAAREMLAKVQAYTGGVKDDQPHFFERSTTGRRSGMDAEQDSGTLPDSVFYQRFAIMGVTSRLTGNARFELHANISADNLDRAFECLACARDVVEFGLYGASNNNSWIMRPLANLQRANDTKEWYTIFETKYATEYTDVGHIEKKTPLAHNFGQMTQEMDDWNNKQVGKKTLSHTK